MAKARILVVEDEAIVGRHIRYCLEQHDYTVVGETARGEDAIVLAQSLQPDLVLMDIRLQGAMDGISAAETIGRAGGIPIVYLTAYADDETLRRARVTEPFGYVLKPFEDRELLMVIEMALYKHAAERRLRESESRLAAILGSIGDGVVAADADGRITFINQAAKAMTGWEDQEIHGARIDAIFSVCDSDSQQPVENPVAAVLRTGTAVTAGEQLLMIGEKGRKLAIDHRAMPIRDDRGWSGAVWVFRDVSERKRAEQRLQLAQRMEAIGQLAGGLAHDVNNLLTVISGYCHLLRSVLREPPTAHDYVAEIDKAAERAGDLTRQLLAFGRRQILKPKVLDLNEVVAAIEQMLQRVIGENIRVVTLLDPALPPTKADPAQLEQVIVNLAVNARDAMPVGGTLTLQTAAIDLPEADSADPADFAPGQYAALHVSDTGHGMEPAVRERVFEPFFTTKELGKGVGLGLSTVYGIIKQSGGHVSVQSTVGEGSTFSVYLPAAAEPVEPLAASPTAAAFASGGETVLLVEDDRPTRSLLVTVLKVFGYNVLEAADAHEALRILESRSVPIHLMVTDLVMPQIGGRELAARVRTLNPDIKVLYMSGYASPETANLLSDDPTPFLSKPFPPAALADAVRRVLTGQPLGG